MTLQLGEWTDGLGNKLTLCRWHHTKAVITPTRWRCGTPRSSVTACRRFALLSDGWRWRPRHPPGIVTRARSGSLLELPQGGSTSPNRPFDHSATVVSNYAAGESAAFNTGVTQRLQSMTNIKTSQMEMCWRVVEGSTARIVTCAVFPFSASGLEVRVGYLLDVPLHSEIVADIHAARALAQDWLRAMRGGTLPRNLQNRNVERQ